MIYQLDNGKKVSLSQLLDMVNPTIQRIYREYSYLNMPQSLYSDIVNKVLDKLLKENNVINTTNFEHTLAEQIKISLIKYLNEIFKSDETKRYEITLSYIDKNIKLSDDYNIILNEINKLSSLFNMLEFLPSMDFLMMLLEDNKFSILVKRIVQRNIDNIKNKPLVDIFEDSIILIIVETYCKINDIAIKDSNLEDEDFDDMLVTKDSTHDYIRQMCKAKLLSKEETQDLLRRAKKGDETARDRLVESNMRLVISIAKRYVNDTSKLEDLAQDGSIGLILAIDKFNPDYGYSLSTYATWWIRQSIQRSIMDSSNTIRIPVHVQEKLYRYEKTLKNLEGEIGRSPDLEEITKATGLSKEKIDELHSLPLGILSLDAKLADDDNSCEFFELVPSDVNLEEDTINKSLADSVRKLIEAANLTDKEKEVITMRYGLNGTSMTLNELGQKFDLTRERIRQIEKNAIRKLRKTKGARELSVYMDNPTEAETYLAGTKNLTSSELNIYNYFSRSTPDKLVLILSYLTEEDIRILKSVLGEDLRRPQKNYVREVIYGNKFLHAVGKIRSHSKEVDYIYHGIKTIYDYFPKYSKAKVDRAIDNISPEDKELIFLVYKNANVKEINSHLSEKDKAKFYHALNSILEELLKQKEKSKLKKEENSVFYVYEGNTEEHELTKDDYIKIAKFIESPQYKYLNSLLSMKSAIMWAMRFGYIDGIYYSIKAIAKFLEISEGQVDTTLRYLHQCYKDRIIKVNYDKFVKKLKK